MQIDQVRSDILQWIQDFVEVPREDLGNWPPCPFARAARLNNLLDIRLGGADPYIDMRAVTDLSGFEVIVLVYDPSEFAAEEFNDLVHRANDAFLAGRGLIALADHPSDPEVVCGVTMNQGDYALVFVQDLAKLNGHARQLASQGFYDLWPQDYLQALFRGRQDPRS
jgi:hypothetical protein